MGGGKITSLLVSPAHVKTGGRGEPFSAISRVGTTLFGKSADESVCPEKLLQVALVSHQLKEIFLCALMPYHYQSTH